jgi:hypothetical protein
MWAICLGGLVTILITVFFAAAAVSTAKGNTRFGMLGEAALAIANFPNLARKTLSAIGVDLVNPTQFLEVPRQQKNLDGFIALKARPGLNVRGLIVRAEANGLADAAGWRVLIGSFVIDGAPRYAALALTPELRIEHIWTLREDPINGRTPEPNHRKYLHGVAILPDASIIYSFDNGISIQRGDQCGQVIWARGGAFHHAISLSDDRTHLWTLRDYTDLVKLDTATGALLEEINLLEVIAANPDTDILGVRQHDKNDVSANMRNVEPEWSGDRFHLNDVEPLPQALAEYFPSFTPGDLLISARSLNLIFVLNPDTLKIKWWRAGAVRRQHDPDWTRSGLITVYDNRLGLDYSRIVGIAPDTLETRTLIDGRTMDFYSRVRGKHQVTQMGHVLVTSSQQGRVFETDARGRVLLDIQNTKPGSPDKNYVISDAQWLAPGALDFATDPNCKR